MADSKSENSAPTVVLQFDLKGQSNQVINFARAAEEKYGFDALHPRLAAQRARLARVAAAGAALENAQKRAGSGVSADDASEDLPDADDNDDDTDAEMGGGPGMTGLDGAKSGVDEGSEAPESKEVKQKAKRVLKEDMYDVEMDFIDDTELAWEENRQATRDGFFVYMGPLVPAEDKEEKERLVSLACYPLHLLTLFFIVNLIRPLDVAVVEGVALEEAVQESPVVVVHPANSLPPTGKRTRIRIHPLARRLPRTASSSDLVRRRKKKRGWRANKLQQRL